jgi:hypothetical protein
LWSGGIRLMKFSSIKNLFFAFCFLSVISINSTEISYHPTTSTALGFGFLYQFSISTQDDSHFYGFRHYANMNFLEALSHFDYRYYNSEFALLFGKAKRFNTKFSSYIALSSGLAFYHQTRVGEQIGPDQWEGIEKSGIGIPIDLQLTLGLFYFIGVSGNVTVNINRNYNFGGFFLSLHVGDFRNKVKNKK